MGEKQPVAKGEDICSEIIWVAGACGHIAVPWDRSPEKVPRGAVVKWNFEVRTGELKGVGDVPREPLGMLHGSS